jgi:putative serine protease PepD
MGPMNSGEAMNDETVPEASASAASTDSGPDAADNLPTAPPAAPAAATPAHAGAGRSGNSLWRWIALGVLIVAVAAGVFFLGRWSGDGGSGNATAVTTTIAATGNTIGTTDEPVADVAAALSPSVVQIETSAGLGSGFVYRADGYILTAAHVVAGSNQVTVRLADGTRLDGTVVGADQNSDVAVIRVDQTGLPAALLADDASVRVGQIAIAIGSPWGLDQTVTSGVVSSVGRTITGSDGIPRTMIQTDAPINPGNSGGALADRHARVIGINDAIYSSSGGSEGVGFAIPIDTARSVAERLIAGEEIRTALLGVNGTDPTTGPVGALVTGILKDSPAAAAGLQVGDLVTGYDGRPIQSFTDLGAAVRSSQPGDTVTLNVTRAGQQITVQVTLAERPAD